MVKRKTKNGIGLETLTENAVLDSSNAYDSISKETAFNPAITFQEYFQREINLMKFKLKELKAIAVYNNLPFSGTKTVVSERISAFFMKNKMAIKIQRWIRGNFVRMVLSRELRGEAMHNRTLCVNGTDFMTMEPIDEIPFEKFFSYTDENNFTFGFDIHSFILYIRKTSGKLENPYNRTELPSIVIIKAILLYKLVSLIFPDQKIDGDKPYVANPMYMTRRRRRRTFRQRNRPRFNPYVDQEPYIDQERTQTPDTTTFVPNDDEEDDDNDDDDRSTTAASTITRYQQATISFLSNGSEVTAQELITQILQRQLHMIAVRNKPLHIRIHELFMEIDQLGNYTRSDWFFELSINQLNNLYRSLLNLWRFHSQIPFDVKHCICPIEDPFVPSHAFPQANDNDNDSMLDYLRNVCLEPMENMVFSGIDDEYRKLGAFQVLAALTNVSEGANTTLRWLYEAVYT